VRITSILVLTAALTMAGAVLIAPRPRAAQALEFRLVVNQTNPVTSVERRFLEDAYLKKVTRWSTGQLIRPVDLTPGSAARAQFSQEILRRSVAAVKSYWQQLIFSGRDVPPPEFDTEEQVVRYVINHDGAVGYVSGGASANGTKILTVR
jgi:ABC-type phosphate transport system substrate-binding protein